MFQDKGRLYRSKDGRVVRKYSDKDLITDLYKNVILECDIKPYSEMGTFWTYMNRDVIIRYDEGTFGGNYFDNLSQKYLLQLDQRKSGEFSSPNNAIIYNADGSIHMALSAPELIGRLANKYKKVDRLYGYAFGGLAPYHYKNSKGEEVIGISILFPEQYRNMYGNFFEVREINLETGKFGEVLQTGAV